jgi:cytochrome c-type biogenesis protein CcmH
MGKRRLARSLALTLPSPRRRAESASVARSDQPLGRAAAASFHIVSQHRTFAARGKGFLAAALCALALHATAADTAADDPAIETRMKRIAAELRCLVCQNQTIADSTADLAVDLREQVRRMLRNGDSDERILQFMTERYGDFVLYRPPLKTATLLLWFGPAALLAGGFATLAIVLRRRARMGDDRFDPDTSGEADEGAPA